MSNTSNELPEKAGRDNVDPEDPATKRFFVKEGDFVITKRVVEPSGDEPDERNPETIVP